MPAPKSQTTPPSIFVHGRHDDPTELEAVLNAAEEAGGALLYFHGGLSGRTYIETELGLQLRSSLLSEANLSNGPKAGLHPIFVIYDAGIFDHEKLLDYLKESTIATVVRWLADRFGGEAALRLNGRKQDELLQAAGKEFLVRRNKSTLNDEDIADLLQNEPAVRSLAAELERNDHDVTRITAEVAERAALKRARLPALSALKPAVIAVKVAARFALRLNHQFVPTIEEEVLRELCFLRIVDVELFAQHHWRTVYDRTEECWESGKNGRRLIAGLAGLRAKAEKEGRPFPIHAMSHSAGSIAISRLVKHLAEVNGPKLDQIIMIAPAVRHALFAETVVKHPESYTHFRAFILQDAKEATDELVWGIYPASLLYFVSGFCEETGSGDCLLLTERHLTRRWPYTAWWYPKTIGRQQGDFEAVWRFFDTRGRRILCPDNSGTPGEDNDGESHENTKLPWCTRRLGKAVLFLLTKKEVKDTDIPAPPPPLKSKCPVIASSRNHEKDALEQICGSLAQDAAKPRRKTRSQRRTPKKSRR